MKKLEGQWLEYVRRQPRRLSLLRNRNYSLTMGTDTRLIGKLLPEH